MKYLDFTDYFVFPVYLIIILAFAFQIKQRNIEKNPIYKYYIPGLFLKILGGFVFALIYIFYYGGGDTLSYYQGGVAISKMFFKAPDIFFSLLSGVRSDENWSYFDTNTGWPLQEMFQLKPDSFAVSRFSAPFLLISFNSFLTGLALLNFFLFHFIWKFYTMVCELYPKMYKQIAIAILFVPSVLFWGSGYMKDTYTFAAALYFTFNFYQIFIKKENLRTNIAAIIVNVFVMITLKPYVFVALLPATLLWISHSRTQRIQNATARVMAAPFMLFIGLGFGAFLLSLMGGSLGAYGSVDKMITKAQVTQQDLVRGEAYGDHFFDIGKFDPTIQGILGKAPVAIMAGLFRPYIWEVGSLVMFFSGLENLILLIVTIWILIRVGPFKTVSFITNEPLLLFSLIFAIIMAFSVGLTSANFGALVRYKIPAIPFYVITLFVLYNKMKEMKVPTPE